jgi:hypothetical protein
MALVCNNPEHWRTRANEARELAAKMTDIVGRARMLSIADDYEKIVGRAVQRLTSIALAGAVRE